MTPKKTSVPPGDCCEDYAADMRKVLTELVGTLGSTVLPQAAFFALIQAELFLEQNRVGA